MSTYKGTSPFDQSVEKATPDKSSSDAEWAHIFDICDKVGQSSSGPKECLKAIMNRLSFNSKNVQLHTLTLLDSCIMNCGAPFHKEVATAEFIAESRSLLDKASTDVADKYKEFLKKWSENEFKSDSSLSAIPSFYNNLRKEGAYFGMNTGSSKAASGKSSSAPEDSDLERALALSLKEAQEKAPTSTLYPQMTSVVPQSSSSNRYSSGSDTYMMQQSNMKLEKQVRALYDFEAVEDNELTFKTGDLIIVTDDSDQNWWKGKSWRGEGLFPANFVTTDVSQDTQEESSKKKGVQFNEEVAVQQFDPENAKIDEDVINQALDEIQNADPTGLTADSQEMLNLEEECKAMAPLIDGELEQIDMKHNELMMLNQKLVDAFQMYTQLMTDIPQYTSPAGNYVNQQAASLPQTQQPTQTLTSYQSLSSSNSAMVYGQADPMAPNQSYYSAGGYNSQAPMQVAPELPLQDASSQNYNQSAILQQYQINAPALNSLPYIPSTGVHNVNQGFIQGYPQVPNSQQLS